MGDVGSFLFGSSDPGGYTGENAPLLNEGQQGNLNALTGVLQRNIGQGVDSYGGTYTPGATGTQGQTFDLVQQLLSGGGTTGQGQDFLSGLMKPYDQTAANEFFTKGVQDPTMKSWEEDVLPQIQEHFIGQNAGRSGAANRAISGSAADLMQGLSGERARTLYGDKQQYTQNAMGAIGQNAQIQQLLTSLGLSAGGAERGIQGEQLMEGYNDWQTEQDYNNPWLQHMGLAMGTKAFEPIINQPFQTEGALGDMMSMAGGLATGISGLTSMLSGPKKKPQVAVVEK